MKVTKEEALAYVRGLEEENKRLKEENKFLQNRCYALTYGQFCRYCGVTCEHKEKH